MHNRDEVREFPTSRRAKITPEQAGLPGGSRRRVTGLRRSEVAALADVSVEYGACGGPWTPSRPGRRSSSTGRLDVLAVNHRLDVLAVNQLARAFFTDLYTDHVQPPNLARYQFLDPAARRFYPDWDRAAGMTVDLLRTEAGADPHDKDLHDLIGELSTRCDDFRTRWGAHNVTHHQFTAPNHHAHVGDD